MRRPPYDMPRPPYSHHRCRSITNILIKRGEIPLTACVDCGVPRGFFPMHIHHNDYQNPRDVVWLCIDCHWQSNSILCQPWIPSMDTHCTLEPNILGDMPIRKWSNGPIEAA